jgi:hypothetical protein
MLTLTEFCFSIDTETPNFLEDLKIRHFIRDSVESV